MSLLDSDRWQEIFETVRRNKLRAVLTSLAVAWGIFMLVILLGAGNGLRNGVTHTFRDDAVNSIWLFPGTTALPFEGLPPGRRLKFANEDYDRFREHLDGVDKITGRFQPGEQLPCAYGHKAAAFDIRAVHPDHLFLENTKMVAGRFINDLDLDGRRKVAVIGSAVTKVLAPGSPPLSLMGEQIAIGGIPYRVVGIFEDEGGEDERRRIYLPISTAQTTWGGGTRVDRLMFTVDDTSDAGSQRIAAEAKRMLAERYSFDPADKGAVRVRNNLEEYRKILRVLDGIALFVWMIGLGTIVAGIVGVSNIMLISVKERTKEIGLRKALGATPLSIITMILLEAILITAVAGYLGLVAGLGVLELGRELIPSSDYFRNPEVKVELAMIATAILVASGALAGFFPARRAARVSPVVALRDE